MLKIIDGIKEQDYWKELESFASKSPDDDLKLQAFIKYVSGGRG
ncbi:hypothetical protein KKC1_09700 [Calderihabitans maritimus]|uniref:Uncharacterized protein n=1 Tax=Calderihabitans maritimus TaxID=1246530 RepID=A0A1Z5HRB4_9FIRM|nr:hypothetical protein KKC1_09700 [Calderihabitans maritimus]